MGPFSLLLFLWSPLPLATEEEEATALGMRGGGQSPLFPSFLPSSFPRGVPPWSDKAKGKAFPSLLRRWRVIRSLRTRATELLRIPRKKNGGKKGVAAVPLVSVQILIEEVKSAQFRCSQHLTTKAKGVYSGLGVWKKYRLWWCFFCGGAKRGPFVGLFALLSARGRAPIHSTPTSFAETQ